MNQELANQAFIYGLPLVDNLNHIKAAVKEGFGTNPPSPYNVAFSNATTLSNASDHFVSINNDTIYSTVQMDLSVGPLLFEIPEITDRYYVFQFIDAWTDNYAYLGTRSLGSKGGKFIITPPDYDDDIPDGYTEIPSPTRFGELFGRFEVFGEDDLKNVAKIQSELKIRQMYPDEVATGIPDVQKTADGDALHFWEEFRVYLNLDPAAPRYNDIIEAYSQFGITGDNDTYVNPDPVLVETLEKASGEALEYMKHQETHTPFPEENGWQEVFHLFDYNFDYFDFGTIDSPEWQLPHANLTELNEAMEIRAGAAIGGLWGNSGYEAAYLPNYVDSEGNQLNGENTYEVTFQQTPPTNAFWSITMYDVPKFELVANPINRYSIGNRTQGLVTNVDGSLTIVVSNKRPDKLASNWLPAPAGDFRPILRDYLPKKAIFDGSYVFPPFVKVTK